MSHFSETKGRGRSLLDMRLVQAVFAVSILVTAACASGQNASRVPSPDLPYPVPVRDILFAQPFTVSRPFQTWSRDRAKATSGTLVVLDVDPRYVVPRDAMANPVLYAGNVAVIQLNEGHKSGRVIGIIPGNVDLASEPVWFGAPDLPERVTPESARAERARAEEAGVRPFARSKIAAVQRPATRTADVSALLRDVAAELVYEYAPQEKDLAEKWRLPVATAPNKPR